jgi:hypothetical protein
MKSVARRFYVTIVSYLSKSRIPGGLIAVLLLLILGTTSNLLANPIAGPIVDPANGYSYYLLPNSDWTDAQAQALSLGGNLATVQNAAENSWICQTFTNFGSVARSLWIGLNAAGKDGSVASNYSWVDGSSASYRNWATNPQQPDYFNEQYVYILPGVYGSSGGQWNNAQNDTSFGWTSGPVVENFGVAEVVPEPNVCLLVMLGSFVLLRRFFGRRGC